MGAVTDAVAPGLASLSLNRKKSLKRNLSYKETHVAITKVEGTLVKTPKPQNPIIEHSNAMQFKTRKL